MTNPHRLRFCCSLLFPVSSPNFPDFESLLITPNGIQSERRRGRIGRDAEGGGASGADATNRIPTETGENTNRALNRIQLWTEPGSEPDPALDRTGL